MMNLSRSLKFRCHEWFADHFSFVQYPNVRGPQLSFFKNDMPLISRVFLVVMGGFTLTVCAFFLFLLGVLFWAIFTA